MTKITSKESATGIPVIKTYKYGAGESGVGRPLFSSNQLNYSGEQIVAGPLCDGVNPPDVVNRIRTYHSSSFDVEESAPVVYPYVTEYLGDWAGTTNGKIIYEFDAGFIPADMDQTVPPSSKVFRNTYGWKRGKLTMKTVYDKLNNKLSESVTVYSTLKEVGVLVGIGAYTFRVGNGTPCAVGSCTNEYGQIVPDDVYHASTYMQSSGVMMPTTNIETTYENGNINNNVTKTITSSFDVNKLALLFRTETQSNSAVERVTANRYPFQFSTVSQSAVGDAKGIYLLNSKNILTIPLESYVYLQNSGGTNQKVISGQVSTYRQNSNNTAHVVPDKVYLLELTEPVNNFGFGPDPFFPTVVVDAGVTMDSRYKQRLVFASYDANSNILQASKTKDTPISFQYGYNSFLPVAEIKNAQNSTSLVEFKLEGFEDLSIANVVDNAAQAYSGRKYYNGDYTISFTKPNTRNYIIEYYSYTAPNWNYITKTYTGPTMALTEGTRIDNIRIRPADSFMTSYTYHPLFGISSVTDPNGVTTFYEYDTFGRLQLVKDYNLNATSTYQYHYYKQQ